MSGAITTLGCRCALLEEIPGPSGLLGVITRNRYGARVLSTEAVVIADVDLPARRRGAALLGRLFGGVAGKEKDPADSPESLALQRIRSYADRSPTRGTHVYRTAAGLRVIVTGPLTAPGSPEAEALLRELGTDPIYTRLCVTHGTYRARLSPKPWRLDPALPAPPVRWPYQSMQHQVSAADWLKEYQARSAAYAVCARIATYGAPAAPDQRTLIEVHDQETGADRQVSLA